MELLPLDRDWVAARLPARSSHAHKGTFGRVLVVAGSLEYSGAALLAGLGAARTGAGLVSLATPESVGMRLMGFVPELTLTLLAEEAPGLTSPSGWRRLAASAATFDALVIGPGLGQQPGTMRRVRNLIAEIERPAVIDADALNALAAADRWWIHLPHAVLTPHPGEFARLAGAMPPDDDRARATAAAEAAARWGQAVVLKGANTVVAAPEGEVRRSPVATPALATAGSGDVLAGAIGALLAGGLDPFDAAGCGVALHAAAGMLAEERIGPAGTIARDIAQLLPEAARSFGPRRT
jgi:NAD(P)H-hydrate epimerase